MVARPALRPRRRRRRRISVSTLEEVSFPEAARDFRNNFFASKLTRMSNDKLRNIIEGGSSVVGATASAAISVVTGSPEFGVGAAGLNASGAYRRVGTEIANWMLGPREEARIGGVMALSADVLRTKLAEGYHLREDGFFKPQAANRPAAEELLEGVLRKAQAEYEERKLPYLARFWANACIDTRIKPPTLNQLIRLSEQLTYSNLVMISLVARIDEILGSPIYSQKYHIDPSSRAVANIVRMDAQHSILAEIRMLAGLDCVRFGDLSRADRESLSGVELGTYGAALHHLMELHLVPHRERRAIRKQISIDGYPRRKAARQSVTQETTT